MVNPMREMWEDYEALHARDDTSPPGDVTPCTACTAAACGRAVEQALMEEGWSVTEQFRVGKDVKDLVASLLPQEGEPCERHRLKREDYE